VESMKKINKILYGGDYNPEQWPEEIWPDDMKLLKNAGIDTVTLNVFSWAEIQPSEDRYDFSRLDRIMEMVRKNHLHVIMATSTAVHPAWMAEKYPDVLRTDFRGIGRRYGQRHNSCPNSTNYRRLSAALAGTLARRYRTFENIEAWHVCNEYGGECFCDSCAAAFRLWLKEKYGTLKALNEAWYTAFWSHTFYDWDEITVPDLRSECDDERHSRYPVISLDYRRFQSDSLLECFKLERDAIKKEIPDAQVTTNLMGFFKGLDYQKWAGEMDFISWDNYPTNSDVWADIAMPHDLMRGVKGGRSFALMEQTPGTAAWRPYNELKRPGVMRLWSWQAVAHGADTVMFFQMRKSRGGYEQFHGAVIDHTGTGNTRVYREVAKLGKELETLGDGTLGARTPSGVGILFTWDNWWAVDWMSGPSQDFEYLTEVRRFYRALRELNINTDILSPEDDFSPYRVIFAPAMFMVRTGEDEKIRSFTKNGGTFVTSFMSGIVDENDQVTLGGYPGKLRDILGIWVEESDGLLPGMRNSFSYHGREYPAEIICDLIHTEHARRLDDSGYGSDFYQSMPAVTKNSFGNGKAYYVGTASSDEFYRTLCRDICSEAGITPVLDVPEGVEACSRVNDKGTWYFILNHSSEEQTIELPWAAWDALKNEERKPGSYVLGPKDVLILKTV
jgi:beta-galactosidase